MGAGDSAHSVARRAEASAEVYRKRAVAAERFAAQFRTGAEGEAALHAVLTGLIERGWTPLPDRRSPRGGNIDELLVGPTGVVVLDAKTWSDPVRVADDRLYGGSFRRTKHLQRVLTQVDFVRSALAGAGLDRVAVRGVIVLTNGVDSDHPPEKVRGVYVMGLNHVQARFASLPTVLQVETLPKVEAVVDVAFPRHDAVSLVVPEATPPTSDSWKLPQNTRLFYFRVWRSRRLYVKDSDGVDCAWKDLANDGMHIECTEISAKLVSAMLRGATRSGIAISAEQLPRIPATFSAGTILERFRHRYLSVLLGWESAPRGGPRLNGTYLAPGRGTFTLGYVVLRTGKIFPSVKGPLGPNLGTADEYLSLLAQRWPSRNRPGAAPKGISPT